MSDIAVRVEGMGKAYRIQHQRARGGYRTLQEDVMALLRRRRRETSGSEEFWALKDVSFEVRQGEVLGIIGRNGAGKSTLLKILSRITRPSTGIAEIHGRVGSLLEVGTGFHPELTGRENVFLNGAILGMSRRDIQRQFDSIVAFAEVEQFLDTPVKRYSSGMYMRLAFAVAAHLEPEILIVDEVLAVGDAEFQKKCLGKMGEVARSGRTVLFVSHNMGAVEALCSNAILLSHGKIESSSTNVRSVVTNYLKTGASDDSEWTNSGHDFLNDYFTPTRFTVVASDGTKLDMPLQANQDAFVQLEGFVEVLDPSLTIGYAVFTENEQVLFWSYQTDGAESKWPALRKGPCVLRGHLPKHFLNEGRYRIELIGGLHFRQWLFEPSVRAPAIHINVQGGLSESPYYMTRRPTLLAPILEWSLHSTAEDRGITRRETQ